MTAVSATQSLILSRAAQRPGSLALPLPAGWTAQTMQGGQNVYALHGASHASLVGTVAPAARRNARFASPATTRTPRASPAAST